MPTHAPQESASAHDDASRRTPSPKARPAPRPAPTRPACAFCKRTRVPPIRLDEDGGHRVLTACLPCLRSRALMQASSSIPRGLWLLRQKAEEQQMLLWRSDHAGYLLPAPEPTDPDPDGPPNMFVAPNQHVRVVGPEPMASAKSASSGELMNVTKNARKKKQGAPDLKAIRERAYEIFLAGDREPGHEAEHWAQAERELGVVPETVAR